MSSDLNLRDTPVNPPADYAEVQEKTAVKGAQSSSADEADAGIKLVPRPEDVTAFNSAAEPEGAVFGKVAKPTETVGRPHEEAKRERLASHGMSDQKKGY